MQVKQSRFTLILLGIIAAGVLVLVVSFSLLQHQNTKTRQLKESYQQRQQEYETRDMQMRHLQDDEEMLAGLKTRLAQLNLNLVAYRYVPSYLRELQARTLQTNILIKSIVPNEVRPLDLSNSLFAVKKPGGNTPAATTEAKPVENAENSMPTAVAVKKALPYQVMNITLIVQGNYLSILKLLNEFRLFPKMIYVKSVDLSPQRTDGHTTITARIQTYAIIAPEQYKEQETAQPTQASVAEGGKQ